MIKVYMTKTTYPSGMKKFRNFTEEAFEEFKKCIGYIPEGRGYLYTAETDEGFNTLEVVNVIEVIDKW
jgi:hypothetical protein